MKDNAKAKKKTPLFYNFHYDTVKFTGALPTLLFLRPKIYYPFGKPNKKGAIMVSANHNTMIDPVIVHMVFPFRRINSLATKDLFSSKFKSWFFTAMHCIVVDKENFSLSSFHEVTERLKDGKLVVIFPEGKLNSDNKDSLLAFKSGATLMAHRAGASILPMYIVKRKKWYHRQRIVVGQPLNVAEMLGKMPSMQDLSKATDLLREKEVELKSYYESLPEYKKLST